MKYKSLRALYEEAVIRMANEPEYWEQFLKYAGQMYRYNFSTLASAFIQNPEYDQLATYEDWKRLGAQVRRGEKSIPALMNNHFRMSHMFDASQLESKPNIKNWEVRDTEKEKFKELFISKNEDLKSSLIQRFEDIKAVKIINILNDLYKQPGNDGIAKFDEVIYQSIDYVTSYRCNLDNVVKLPSMELLDIKNMTAVGWCTMTAARTFLLESKEIVREIRREEQLHEQHKNELQREGRSSLRSSGRGEERPVQQSAGTIRTAGKEVLGGESGTGNGIHGNSRNHDAENARIGGNDKAGGSHPDETAAEKSSGYEQPGTSDLGGTNSPEENIEMKDTEKEVDKNAASFFRIKYFDIDEKMAKAAHTLMSFRDYVPDSKTNEYRRMVDQVYEIAKKIQEEKPDETERAYRLAERYSKKLADNFNAASRIGCMCPSVMISGAGNFPVAKKEKQNKAAEKNHKEFSEIEQIKDKLKNILHGNEIIKLSDENAIEKLEKKLEELEKRQNDMKAANAFYRKNKTLEGCQSISSEVARAFMKNKQPGERPFSSYQLTNNNQNIHRVRNRLEALRKAKSLDNTEESTEWFKIIRNREQMRLQLIFDGKPNEQMRQLLKHNAFKWSPKNGAWQRQLTSNAEYSLKRVIESLEKTAPKQTLSFYVAECMEFPNLGEYHDNLTLDEAVERYNQIPEERMNGIKGIGFKLHTEGNKEYEDQEFEILGGNKIDVETINHILEFKESNLVQQAIKDVIGKFPDATVCLGEFSTSRNKLQRAVEIMENFQEEQCEEFGMEMDMEP